MKEYKDTLLMPKTDFPMRGNLGVNEIPIQKKWEEDKIYEKVLKKNEGKQPFYLHDGPPYANGKIHVGHAMNKILKDILIRYKTMNGFYSPYLPGWDTHGLPIETALSKNKKINRKEMPIAEFRNLCEKYALEQVELQKVGFKRLGILGEWEHPYITLNNHYEAEQIRCFGIMASKNLIFKGLKPVYWSPSSETALAEAEIEYRDVKSSSIYIAFKVVDGKNVLSNNCELIIWTTTPWTMPANLAICVSPTIEYSVVEADGRYFVMATELINDVCEKLGFANYSVVKRMLGAELEKITYKHPLYDRISPVILGDHVTLDAGTGLVHTAPGHGEDDFIVGKKYGLDILCPVDGRGYLTKEAGEFAGLFYEDANRVIINRLNEENALLKEIEIIHSYPHDWRTKKPIIFRATSQWFASIHNFKEDILNAIKNVNWVPTWGEVRISNMIKDRNDWCISRQRVWGVPIPIFYAEDETPIIDQHVINHVANLFEEYGSNVWFEREAKDLLPEGFTHPSSPNGKFTKENDIMDVWFDSGTSHHAALKLKYGVEQADVYLEGSDQYRGWFNSSLTTSVALTGKAPYKTVISHGFTLDGEGHKMSKSLGNTIDPIASCNEFGADIFRLWVASVEYQADFKMSKELLKQVSEAYRKIRNTFRFLLGNLFDFNPISDSISYDKMAEIDQYMMCKLNEVVKNVHNAYNNYEFSEVFRTILNFMTNELSSFYLDFTKDILYIDDAEANSRRSIQTVLYETLKALTTLFTPIIPHTAEEVYKYMPGIKEESIYLVDMYQPTLFKGSDEILSKYEDLMKVRDDVLKALEEARSEKVIGKSLNANVMIYPTDKVAKLLTTVKVDLKQIFIVYKFTIAPNDFEGKVYSSGKIKIEPANGYTCSRCWQIVPSINPDELCPRCAEVVNNLKMKK